MGSQQRSKRHFSKANGVVRVFQENESIIKRFLRRFSSHQQDIDDICQETILRALEAEKSKEIREPRAFLFGVARNVARKELDKRSRQLVDFLEEFTPEQYASEEPSVEDSIDSKQRMLIFGDAVASLPAQCQKVFILKKVHGYSHKDVSKHLGISVSTVEKHVASGLKRCSDYMIRHESESAARGVGRALAITPRGTKSQ